MIELPAGAELASFDVLVCPGCRDWQLEVPRHPEIGYVPSMGETESVLRDHLQECPQLRAELLGRVMSPDLDLFPLEHRPSHYPGKYPAPPLDHADPAT